jgi:two-component system, OmpR family, sensor kinase
MHRNEAVISGREEAELSTAEQLITIMAHDLRNYLTPLLGRISWIAHQATRDGLMSYAEHAQAMAVTVRRMDKIIGDLLDITKLEQDLLALAKKDVDLTALAQETASAVTTPLCPVAVESAAPVHAEADPGKIRQALENLLFNAIKYSPEGAVVRIVVTIDMQDDSKQALIIVQDRGPGIDPAIMPRLFTRFAPGPRSTGLGLGLFLARGIIVAHGGSLTAESSAGTGATFRMTLPIEAAGVAQR